MNYALSTQFVKIAGAAAYNLNGLANTLWTMCADFFIFNRDFVRLSLNIELEMDCNNWICDHNSWSCTVLC